MPYAPVQHLAPCGVKEVGEVHERPVHIVYLEAADDETCFELRDDDRVIGKAVAARNYLKPLRLHAL